MGSRHSSMEDDSSSSSSSAPSSPSSSSSSSASESGDAVALHLLGTLWGAQDASAPSHGDDGAADPSPRVRSAWWGGDGDGEDWMEDVPGSWGLDASPRVQRDSRRATVEPPTTLTDQAMRVVVQPHMDLEILRYLVAHGCVQPQCLVTMHMVDAANLDQRTPAHEAMLRCCRNIHAGGDLEAAIVDLSRDFEFLQDCFPNLWFDLHLLMFAYMVCASLGRVRHGGDSCAAAQGAEAASEGEGPELGSGSCSSRRSASKRRVQERSDGGGPAEVDTDPSTCEPPLKRQHGESPHMEEEATGWVHVDWTDLPSFAEGMNIDSEPSRSASRASSSNLSRKEYSVHVCWMKCMSKLSVQAKTVLKGNRTKMERLRELLVANLDLSPGRVGTTPGDSFSLPVHPHLEIILARACMNMRFEIQNLILSRHPTSTSPLMVEFLLKYISLFSRHILNGPPANPNHDFRGADVETLFGVGSEPTPACIHSMGSATENDVLSLLKNLFPKVPSLVSATEANQSFRGEVHTMLGVHRPRVQSEDWQKFLGMGSDSVSDYSLISSQKLLKSIFLERRINYSYLIPLLVNHCFQRGLVSQKGVDKVLLTGPVSRSFLMCHSELPVTSETLTSPRFLGQETNSPHCSSSTVLRGDSSATQTSTTRGCSTDRRSQATAVRGLEELCGTAFLLQTLFCKREPSPLLSACHVHIPLWSKRNPEMYIRLLVWQFLSSDHFCLINKPDSSRAAMLALVEEFQALTKKCRDLLVPGTPEEQVTAARLVLEECSLALFDRQHEVVTRLLPGHGPSRDSSSCALFSSILDELRRSHRSESGGTCVAKPSPMLSFPFLSPSSSISSTCSSVSSDNQVTPDTTLGCLMASMFGILLSRDLSNLVSQNRDLIEHIWALGGEFFGKFRGIQSQAFQDVHARMQRMIPIRRRGTEVRIFPRTRHPSTHPEWLDRPRRGFPSSSEELQPPARHSRHRRMGYFGMIDQAPLEVPAGLSSDEEAPSPSNNQIGLLRAAVPNRSRAEYRHALVRAGGNLNVAAGWLIDHSS